MAQAPGNETTKLFSRLIALIRGPQGQTTPGEDQTKAAEATAGPQPSSPETGLPRAAETSIAPSAKTSPEDHPISLPDERGDATANVPTAPRQDEIVSTPAYSSPSTDHAAPALPALIDVPVAHPPAMTQSTAVPSQPPLRRWHRRNQSIWMLQFARRPGFCCGCICLQGEDRLRLRRILRIVRSAVRVQRRDTEAQIRSRGLRAWLSRMRRSGG